MFHVKRVGQPRVTIGTLATDDGRTWHFGCHCSTLTTEYCKHIKIIVLVNQVCTFHVKHIIESEDNMAITEREKKIDEILRKFNNLQGFRIKNLGVYKCYGEMVESGFCDSDIAISYDDGSTEYRNFYFSEYYDDVTVENIVLFIVKCRMLEISPKIDKALNECLMEFGAMMVM